MHKRSAHGLIHLENFSVKKLNIINKLRCVKLLNNYTNTLAMCVKAFMLNAYAKFMLKHIFICMDKKTN